MSAIKVTIHRDDTHECPRKDYDNLGTMACWHNRYNLGDVQPKEDADEWLAENAPKGSVVLPLFLYDHSGITMSTGSFGDPWDSGQVGVIVCSPEKIRAEYSVKRITAKVRAKVEAILRQEVATYDDYLTGNVWGFVIEAPASPCDKCTCTPEPEHVDSCWGFYGDALDAMKDHVDAKYHDALEAAWDNR